MKIAFFGTSDRSRSILEALKANFDLSLCVTKVDVVVGRKQVTRETDVKKWAKEHSIPYFEITNLKTDAESLIETLKKYEINLGIVADFSYILTENVISTCNAGMINIHFSLLPKLRGASPVQFAIMQKLPKTGVTYYKMGKGLDDGDIIHQFEYQLDNKVTSGKLYEVLFKSAAQELPNVVQQYISNSIDLIKQDQSEATYTYSPSHPRNTFIYKEDAQINWHEEITTIEAKIRAFNPWPIAWTTLKDLQDSPLKLSIKKDKDLNLKVKIYAAQIDLVSKLHIEQLQVECGKIIDWNSFKNGYLEN